MITHVPTPFDRLMERLAARFGAWLDTLCVEQTEARAAGGVPGRLRRRRRRVCRPSFARLSRELMAR